MTEERISDTELLKSIGLSEQKAKETLKNVEIMKHLKIVIFEAKKHTAVNNENGTLLYHLASKTKAQIINKLPIIAQYIADKKIESIQRVDAALNYFLSNPQDSVDVPKFEAACGVGIIISPEEIEAEVEKLIKFHKDEIVKKRYRFNIGPLMQEVRNKLKWADGKAIKNEFDVQLFDLLGMKTEADLAPVQKIPKQAKSKSKSADEKKIVEKNDTNSSKKNQQNSSKESTGVPTISELMKTKMNFHKPGENYKTEGYVITPQTESILKEHLRVTGGKVITRFPPEPNGILHIGHAKAININFGYAAAHDGICYLRYDDTNPEKEEEKFFIAIKEMVEWLGYKPYKITHSSDYLQKLYDYAVELIKRNKAYVCHQRSEHMKGFDCPASPWRDRPIDENLRLFQDMKDGLYEEGEATLRMKVTLEEGKQDPVAYRIKYASHHRTGDEWCIYPTYDFTHCLCDSIENITHSLCTKEFQSRRSSYYWLCNSLDIYCPVQWEYGRLNVNYTVVSKRKIAKLIDEGIVNDWDDPRLFTLTALKRRGFPPEAINNFCAQMGVTVAQCSVDPAALDAAVRDVLNVTAPRHMIVLNPIKVTIVNFPDKGAIDLDVLDYPNEPSKGRHSIKFDKIIYIDASDFKENEEKGFRRLTPKQSVGLKHAGVILTVQDIEKDVNGAITNIVVKQETVTDQNKSKAFIHWVSQSCPITVRIYSSLFKHKNPEDINEVPNGFLSDVNHDSKQVITAFADAGLESCTKKQTVFQFERIGFFSVDYDTKPGKLVFNRTVPLKEEAGKS